MNKIDQQKAEEEAKIILNNYTAREFNIAEIKAKKLIKKYPNYAVIHNILGLCLSEQKKFKQAIEVLKKLIKIRPDFVLAYSNLGNIYNKLGDKESAKKYFEKAIEINPKLAMAHNNLGNLYRDLKKYDEAIICFKKAIEYNSEIFVFYNNLGVTYQNLGRFKEASEILYKAIEKNPNFAPAHHHLSTIVKYNKDHPHLNAMEKSISNKNIPIEDKMYLNFGIGKAYEDIKNYDKAFIHYKIGNENKRKLINYSIKDDIELFENIKKTFQKNTFDKFKNTGVDDSTPIFILGMPRSGTTLVEQILSSHSKVYGADEVKNYDDTIKKYFYSNEKYNFTENFNKTKNSLLKKIGEEYVESIRKFSKESRYISDKALLNFRWIGLIKLTLPNAKIIHCVRDPKDTCLSIFKNNFAGRLDFSYNLKELVTYFNLYTDLMEHWHKTLPGFVYDIFYERLISNQKNETKKLLESCNLDWEESCMNFHNNKRPVVTASIAQIRQPIYKNSVKSWKNFESHLKLDFKSLKFDH